MFAQNWHRGFCLKKFHQKIMLPPVGIELTTDPHWFRKSDAYQTVLICHSLPVSDIQILIKPCSIQSRNDPSPKYLIGTVR